MGYNGYNLLINGVYWRYNPLTNLLLTSWDILVGKQSLVLQIPCKARCWGTQNPLQIHLHEGIGA